MQIRDSDDETSEQNYHEHERDEEEEEENSQTEEIVGDSIGDTAYSQRFVIKCLMGLAKATADTGDTAEITMDYLDRELCLLWDMATDTHVVLFLIDHGAVHLIIQALAKATGSRDDQDQNKDKNMDKETTSRLIEILVGILTNMCCFPRGMQSVTDQLDYVDLILKNVQSDDSRILLQVFRFVFSCVYYDGDRFSIWLDHLSVSRFADVVTFVLCNSTHCELLKQTFETINCLCSAQENHPDDERFSKLFKDKNIIEHSVTGLREIRGLSEEDEMAYERIEILFVSIHSTLYKVLSECDDRQYLDSVSMLFINMNEILERNLREETDNLNDMICYLLKIFSSNFPPVCCEIDTLFDIVLSHLKKCIISSEIEGDFLEVVNSQMEFLLTMMASVDNNRLILFRKKIDDEVKNVLLHKLKFADEQMTIKYKNIINILHSDEK